MHSSPCSTAMTRFISSTQVTTTRLGRRSPRTCPSSSSASGIAREEKGRARACPFFNARITPARCSFPSMLPARYLYLVDIETNQPLAIFSLEEFDREGEVILYEAQLRAQHNVDDAES